MNRVDHSLTIDEYHAHPAVSRSVLGAAGSSKSAAHFHAKLAKPKNGEALRFGNAFHKYVLEPEIYQENAIDWAETATVGVKFLKAEAELETGKFLVPTAWIPQFKAMADAIRSHDIAGKMLNWRGTIEPSYFWHDEEYGVDVKCRPDFFAKNHCIDLKKTENSWKSAHEDDFWKHVVDFNYDLQVYMNLTGIEKVTGTKPDAFVFIPIEDDTPYGLNVFPAGESVIEAGRIKYHRYMKKYLEFKDSKESYKQTPKILELPEWYMNKLIAGG